jgi:hypothetical protein
MGESPLWTSESIIYKRSKCHIVHVKKFSVLRAEITRNLKFTVAVGTTAACKNM